MTLPSKVHQFLGCLFVHKFIHLFTNLFTYLLIDLLIYLSDQVGYSGEPLGEDMHFTVLSSALCSASSAPVINVICLHVQLTSKETTAESKPQDQDNVPLFTTKLEWLTFFPSGSNSSSSFSIMHRSS